MSDADLKVLIADDEPLAAERLQLLLAKCEGIDLVEPFVVAANLGV